MHAAWLLSATAKSYCDISLTVPVSSCGSDRERERERSENLRNVERKLLQSICQQRWHQEKKSIPVCFCDSTVHTLCDFLFYPLSLLFHLCGGYTERQTQRERRASQTWKRILERNAYDRPEGWKAADMRAAGVENRLFLNSASDEFSLFLNPAKMFTCTCWNALCESCMLLVASVCRCSGLTYKL